MKRHWIIKDQTNLPRNWLPAGTTIVPSSCLVLSSDLIANFHFVAILSFSSYVLKLRNLNVTVILSRFLFFMPTFFNMYAYTHKYALQSDASMVYGTRTWQSFLLLLEFFAEGRQTQLSDFMLFRIHLQPIMSPTCMRSVFSVPSSLFLVRYRPSGISVTLYE